jgi:hypothetical protein
MADAIDRNLVNEALALADAGWIKDTDFNMYHSAIMFSVLVASQHKRYTIIFSGVASFYYVRSYGDFRLEDTGHEFGPGFWAISEWTSAGYYHSGVGSLGVHAEPGNRESEWVGRYHATPNFSIEQLGGMIFIEASRVQIDDRIFEVGYPPGRTDEAEGAEGE